MMEAYGSPPCELAKSSTKITLENPNSLPKGHQHLTGNSIFQQKNPPIGIQNIKNINGILEPYERLQFFAQILAEEHRRKYSFDDTGYTRENRQGDGIPYSFWYENGELKWVLENNSHESGTIFDMIAYLYGEDNFQRQIERLMGSLNYDFSSLSRVKYAENNKLWDNKTEYIDCIPKNIDMYDATKSHSHAVLRERFDIEGVHRDVLSSILLYEWHDKFFCIPASMVEPIQSYTASEPPSLMIGKNVAPAIFLNQSNFSKFPNAKIIFCQDIRLAMKLEALLKKSIGYNYSQFIVTSMFGSDFSAYDWSRLHFREIIFCPAPTHSSLALVKLYKKYCTHPSADKFSILNSFILPFDKAPINENTLSNAEYYIIERSISINEIENIPVFLSKIINRTMDIDQFTKVYKELHIFKGNSTDISSIISSDKSLSNIHLPAEDPKWDVSKAKTIEEVTINHLFKPANLILLIGKKNAGKTYISTLLIKSALHLEERLPLFSSYVGKPYSNIMIVDGESELSDIKDRMEQFGLTNDIGKRIFIISRFDKNFPKWIDYFTLTDPRIRDWLVNHALKNQCRLLVLDNLTDLLGDAVNHPSKSNEIIEWFRKLQKYGVCILICHHKSEIISNPRSTKTDGSQIYRKLARTIINIYGNKEIENKRVGPEIARLKAVEGGLTCGLEFDTCKSAPVLEKIMLWLHFRFDTSEIDYLCDTDYNYKITNLISSGHSSKQIVMINPKSIAESQIPASLLPSDSNPNYATIISSKHKKALEVYQVLLNMRRSVRIGEIVKEFSQDNVVKKGYGEDTIRKLLNYLAEIGFVEITGSGQATRYKALPNPKSCRSP